MRRRAWVAAACLLPLAAVRPAAAGEPVGKPTREDLRRPTPLKSPEEVARLMKKRGIREGEVSEKERGVKEVALAGAVTLQGESRLGFMPLLAHHMAVEHWFVTGLKLEDVKTKMGAGKRCFAKLRGKCELKKLYGGPGQERYGDGLSHGQDWKWVRGYHERVYELEVEKLVWVKSPAEFEKLGVKFATVGYRVGQHIKRKEYAAAFKLLDQCSALAGDVGVFHWDSAGMRVFLKDMLVLRKAPEKWTGADLVKVACALCRAGASDWPWDRQKQGRAEVEAAIEKWPEKTRLRVAPVAVKAWKKLTYRHQRDVALKLLKSIGGAEVDKLGRDFAAAEAELKRLKAEFKKRAAAHDYDGMRKILDAVAPHQKLVLSYEFSESEVKRINRDLGLCQALEKIWGNEKERLKDVKKTVRSLISGKPFDHPDLPDSDHKPRFVEELATHFLPRLKEAEKREVEKLLVARGEKLDPKTDWQASLVLAELLTGVAGKDARKFLPELVRRRRAAGAPERQLKYLEKFLRTAKRKPE